MCLRFLRLVAIPMLAIGMASCLTGKRNQAPPDAPLPGGNPPPPSKSWYSRFLGLDRPLESRTAKRTAENDPKIDPFLPHTNGQSNPTTAIPTASPSRQSVDLSIQTAPSSALGQEVPVRIIAFNRSPNPTGPLSVSQPVPDNVQLLRSDPPASLQGNRLVWNLASIPAGGSQDVNVVYRPARPGMMSLRAEAANRDQSLGTANVGMDVLGNGGIGIRAAPPQLALQVVGPQHARQGEKVSLNVNLSNAGSAAVDNIMLTAELDPGLDHESGARKLEIPIPAMAAGESKSAQLPLTVRGTGQLRTIISATSSGSSARQECVVDVQNSRVEVAVTGPDRVQLNQPTTWLVRVSNPGTVPVDATNVRMQIPAELTYKGSSSESQIDRGTAVWNLGRLGAHESRSVELTAVANQLVERLSLIAVATADRTPEARADLPIEILGKPVLVVSAKGSDEAISVGGRVIYAIELRNTGTLPVRDVNLGVECSQHLKPLFAAGPTITRVEGQRIVGSRIAEIAPGQALMLRIEAEAVNSGDACLKVDATSTMPAEPIHREVITRVVSTRS